MHFIFVVFSLQCKHMYALFQRFILLNNMRHITNTYLIFHLRIQSTFPFILTFHLHFFINLVFFSPFLDYEFSMLNTQTICLWCHLNVQFKSNRHLTAYFLLLLPFLYKHMYTHLHIYTLESILTYRRVQQLNVFILDVAKYELQFVIVIILRQKLNIVVASYN